MQEEERPHPPLKAPFPYFGGKRKVGAQVWERLGNCHIYVEPFAGSLAVLLQRPHAPQIETVNDLDGMIANVWRGIKSDPEKVAYYADDIISEVDLHARHLYLLSVRDDLTIRLMADPDYFDAKAAGWWMWGACAWIGSGWCSGKGSWTAVDGKLTKGEGGIDRKRPHLGHAGRGVHKKKPHLGDDGRGIHRKLPSVGASGRGVHRQLPHLGDGGVDIHRQLPHLGDGGVGIQRQSSHLGNNGRGLFAEEVETLPGGIYTWMGALSERLRRVRVCCGEWDRVMGPAGTTHLGVAGAFIDPPYSHVDRATELYTHDASDIFEKVKAWCAENGKNKSWRIVFAGYADDPEKEKPGPGWTFHTWRSDGGYGSQGEGQGRVNAGREVLWFSPGCLPPRQRSLFDTVEETRVEDE